MQLLKKIWTSNIFKITLLFFCFLLVVLNYYDLSIFPIGPVDTNLTGNAGEWVSGIIAAIALVVSAETLRISAGQIRSLENEKRKERTRNSSAVYCWLERVVDELTGNTTGIKLIVNNKTETPIYTWAIKLENYPAASISNLANGPLFLNRTEILLDNRLATEIKQHDVPPKTEVTFVNAYGESVTRGYLGNLIELI